jgi:uncharacterized membrane protein
MMSCQLPKGALSNSLKSLSLSTETERTAKPILLVSQHGAETDIPVRGGRLTVELLLSIDQMVFGPLHREAQIVCGDGWHGVAPVVA